MNKKLKQLIITVYSIVAILAVANLVATNTLATQGVIVDQIYAQSQTLQEENRLLSYRINSMTNLQTLTAKAEQLGFRPTNDLVILPDSSSVAQLPLSLSHD